MYTNSRRHFSEVSLIDEQSVTNSSVRCQLCGAPVHYMLKIYVLHTQIPRFYLNIIRFRACTTETYISDIFNQLSCQAI